MAVRTIKQAEKIDRTPWIQDYLHDIGVVGVRVNSDIGPACDFVVGLRNELNTCYRLGDPESETEKLYKRAIAFYAEQARGYVKVFDRRTDIYVYLEGHKIPKGSDRYLVA